MKAGWKSAAVMRRRVRASRNVSSTASAPIATPVDIDTCWATRDQRGGAAHARGSTSA